MSTTEQRIAANRVNATLSRGPTTPEGKEIACKNATHHGILSARHLLDDEDPAEFDELLSRLWQSLTPVGAIEEAIVERVAIGIWRQRRLIRSETAAIALTRQPKKIAGGVSSELGRGNGADLKTEDLQPFNPEREGWCRAALAELDAIETMDLASLEAKAPLVIAQLRSDADGDTQSVEKFVADHKGGLVGYIVDLRVWCREQLRHAESRPHVMALAEQIRMKRLMLPADALDVLARYQTMLDNQLYKALRALREAQEWRLKTLQPGTADQPSVADEVAAAA